MPRRNGDGRDDDAARKPVPRPLPSPHRAKAGVGPQGDLQEHGENGREGPPGDHGQGRECLRTIEHAGLLASAGGAAVKQMWRFGSDARSRSVAPSSAGSPPSKTPPERVDRLPKWNGRGHGSQVGSQECHLDRVLQFALPRRGPLRSCQRSLSVPLTDRPVLFRCEPFTSLSPVHARRQPLIPGEPAALCTAAQGIPSGDPRSLTKPFHN